MAVSVTFTAWRRWQNKNRREGGSRGGVAPGISVEERGKMTGQGNMNIDEHMETYRGFIRLSIGGVIVLAVILALMAIFLL